MPTQIQRELALADATLQASGSAVPQLNPVPAPADPARGYGGPGAPLPGGETAQSGTPDLAAIKAAATNAPQPPASGMPQPPTPPGLSGTMYETTTTRTSGSSGLSADAQTRANARLDRVGQANETAIGAEADARQARADYEVRATEQALSDVAQRRREAAAEAALQEHSMAEVERRMQAASDWKPERKNMFGFGAGRGLAAAVAVIAGGWMQGRGMTSTNQFLPFVMKMIDDDVNDQVRKNSANIQFLREQKGDIKAAAAELKKRQLMLVDAELQAKSAAAAAKDPSVQKAIEAYKSASAAKQAEWDAEQRKSLERTVTEQVSRVTTPVAVGGKSVSDQQKARIASLRQYRRNVDIIKQGAESGELQAVTGWQDKLGANWLQEAFGGMSPSQKKLAVALEEMRVFNVMGLPREPSQKLQEKFADIGIPKNDRDIPAAIQRWESIYAEATQDMAGAPLPSEDAPVGAY